MDHNEATRKSIRATIAEIEQSEVRHRIADTTIIDHYFRPDSDALEAWEIIDRIERKLFPAGDASVTSDYQPHWDRDLARGKQGEMFVADIVDALTSQRTEIKTDAWWPKTGRVYVETECMKADGKWHPSGINDTASPVYVFVAGKHRWLIAIETAHLRRAAAYALARHPDNAASQPRGKYQTKGVFVYWCDITRTRDTTLDEH